MVFTPSYLSQTPKVLSFGKRVAFGPAQFWVRPCRSLPAAVVSGGGQRFPALGGMFSQPSAPRPRMGLRAPRGSLPFFTEGESRPPLSHSLWHVSAFWGESRAFPEPRFPRAGARGAPSSRLPAVGAPGATSAA